MATIYCIEDINDLKYIGSTTMTLAARLSAHRMDKKLMKGCSSENLNLSYCIIYELERCDVKKRYEREGYWIDNTECVNKNKVGFDRKKYYRANKEKRKEYYEKNKKHKAEYFKKYYQKNKKQRTEYFIQYRKNNPDKFKGYSKNRYINDVISSVMDAMITQIELNHDEILES